MVGNSCLILRCWRPTCSQEQLESGRASKSSWSALLYVASEPFSGIARRGSTQRPLPPGTPSSSKAATDLCCSIGWRKGSFVFTRYWLLRASSFFLPRMI